MGCTLTTEEVAHIDRTIADLESENAKLRELVRQMAYAISPTSREHMLANLAEQGIKVDE